MRLAGESLNDSHSTSAEDQRGPSTLSHYFSSALAYVPDTIVRIICRVRSKRRDLSLAIWAAFDDVGRVALRAKLKGVGLESGVKQGACSSVGERQNSS